MSEDQKEQIKANNPSICFDCVNARRVNEPHQSKGYVGCVAPFKHYEDFPKMGKYIDCFDRLNYYVDRHARPFASASSDAYSNMLMTNETVKCPFFKAIIRLPKDEDFLF